MNDDIEALRDALVGTTRGPWTISRESPTIIVTSLSHIGLSDDAGVLIGSAAGYPNSGFYPSPTEGIANARFMAAASPDCIARLLNEIERLRARLEVADHGIDGIEARDNTIRLLQADVDLLRPDAERYRWVRDHGEKIAVCYYDADEEYDGKCASWIPFDTRSTDAAIDAAMKEERK